MISQGGRRYRKETEYSSDNQVMSRTLSVRLCCLSFFRQTPFFVLCGPPPYRSLPSLSANSPWGIADKSWTCLAFVTLFKGWPAPIVVLVSASIGQSTFHLSPKTLHLAESISKCAVSPQVWGRGRRSVAIVGTRYAF